MRNVDHRCLKALMKLRYLCAHLNPHLSIQIGERLVEEKYFRLSDNCPADRDTLPLPSRQCLRPAIQELFNAEYARGFQNAFFDFRSGIFSELEAECHVVI